MMPFYKTCDVSITKAAEIGMNVSENLAELALTTDTHLLFNLVIMIMSGTCHILSDGTIDPMTTDINLYWGDIVTSLDLVKDNQIDIEPELRKILKILKEEIY